MFLVNHILTSILSNEIFLFIFLVVALLITSYAKFYIIQAKKPYFQEGTKNMRPLTTFTSGKIQSKILAF